MKARRTSERRENGDGEGRETGRCNVSRRTGPVLRRAPGVVDDLAARVAAMVKRLGSATSEQITAELAARAGLRDDLTRARKLAEKKGWIVRGVQDGHGFRWHAPKVETVEEVRAEG